MTAHARRPNPDLVAVCNLIDGLTNAQYCDWVLAGKPGLASKSPDILKEWIALWKTRLDS